MAGRMGMRGVGVVALAALLGSVPAEADSTSGGDPREAGAAAATRDWPVLRPIEGPRPARRVMGDATYVGSNIGLGKPAVSGTGSRPDWGRSSVD